MTKEDIRDLMGQAPFQPFTVRLTDNRVSRVLARDFVSISPSGRTLTLWDESGIHRMIDVALITEVETTEAA